MSANRINHPARKGITIKAHRGGRSIRLPGGKVTPAEWAQIETAWKASGLSWSDFFLDLLSEIRWADHYFEQAQANNPLNQTAGAAAENINQSNPAAG
jgi:hypothetical protein